MVLQERVEILRNKLLVLRGQIENILQQDWERFKDVNGVITDYVLLLNHCFVNRSDRDVDLDLLKDLQAKLDSEFTKAKDNDYRLQFSYVYALRKGAMMLQELDRHTGIPDDLSKWIKSQLTEDEEDWDETLKFTYFMEEELKKRAKEDDEDVQLLVQTINPEPIEVNNTDLIKRQFMLYSKEVADASREMEDNSSMYVKAPEMCRFVKRLVELLKASSSLMLRDEMKVDNESQGIHRSMQSDDGARVLPSEQGRDDESNLKRKRLLHCFMQRLLGSKIFPHVREPSMCEIKQSSSMQTTTVLVRTRVFKCSL